MLEQFDNIVSYPENLENMSKKEIKQYVSVEVAKAVDAVNPFGINSKSYKWAPLVYFICFWVFMFSMWLLGRNTLCTVIAIILAVVFIGDGFIAIFRRKAYNEFLANNLKNLLKEKERRINAKQHNNRR